MSMRYRISPNRVEFISYFPLGICQMMKIRENGTAIEPDLYAVDSQGENRSETTPKPYMALSNWLAAVSKGSQVGPKGGA